MVTSARLIPSLNPTLWNQRVQVAWAGELERLAGVLDAAVSDATPLSLFNATLNLLSAPGAVLAPLFPKRQPKGEFSSSVLSDALKHVLHGRERKAAKLLCSNGVARVNAETLKALNKLHPGREDELKLPRTTVPQLVVDEQFVSKKLFTDAADFNCSKDPFGWAPSLLFSCRGLKTGFFPSLVRFSCFLANHPTLFPPICATLLSGGILTPLHKLGDEERREREDLNLEPKLRPINSGTMISKLVFAAVLQAPSAKRAAESLAPFQLSLGVSRGTERLVHLCRAAHGSKWMVGKTDFENGFNSFDRQKMLNTHAQLFPEANDLFSFFYGIDAPIFVVDDNHQVTLLWSKQGARQGCTLGTEAFCVGVHPLMVELQRRYPDFHLRILTDDIVPLCPPPLSDTYEAWQACYRRYAEFLSDLKSLAAKLTGLTLNAAKSGLLLPAGAPDPSDEVKLLFPPSFTFTRDGMRIAGSPVGTDAYMSDFVKRKVYEACDKVNTIKGLAKRSPRAAHRLLSACASKLLSFVGSTTPPHITLPLLSHFDDHLQSAFLDVVSPSPLHCSADRLQRAKLKMTLRTPFGCGIFLSAKQAPVSFFVSLSACLSDPLIFRFRLGLSSFAQSVFDELTKVFGGTSTAEWSQMSPVFPSSAAELLDGSRFMPDVTPNRAVSKSALKLVSARALNQFTSLHAPPFSASLSAADAIQALSSTQIGHVFGAVCDPSFALNFDPLAYIAFCRFFLGLPPATTVGQHTVQEGFDYPVQRCLSGHGVHVNPFLDANAIHASSGCPSAQRDCIGRHNAIVRVIAGAASEAGLKVSREPDTHSLLLGEVSKQDCKRVFPKKASKRYKEAFTDLVNTIDMTTSSSCTLSDADKQTLIRQKTDALPLLDPNDATGLRLDFAITNDSTGDTKWGDVTVVNTTSPSYSGAELKAIMSRQLSKNLSVASNLPDLMRSDPSPSLVTRQALKTEKYSRLMLIAGKQHRDGKRPKMPTFVPFAISNLGELSPAAVELHDWISDQFRLKCIKEGARADGCSAADLVYAFRRKLRVRTLFAVAAGIGSMICNAGLPWDPSSFL
jgi:hypothetical protein